MLQAIGWLVATIVLVFIEATTFNLVSVWFAVGGAAALISCLFTDSLQAQSAVFVAVSILCLLALRPLAARLRRPLTPTNGDLNIGRTATILTPVARGLERPGRARRLLCPRRQVPGGRHPQHHPDRRARPHRNACAGQLTAKKGAYPLCHPSSCFS